MYSQLLYETVVVLLYSETKPCASHPIGLLIGEVNEISSVISEVILVLIQSATTSGRHVFRYKR